MLVSLPAVKEDRVTLPLSVRRAGGVTLREPATLTLKLESGQTFDAGSAGPLVEGALLAIDGVRVEQLPPPRPGSFDYGRYLRRRGQRVLLEGSFADLRLVGRRGGLQGLVDRLRGASRQHLRAGVHPPVSEVLQGMVLGDDQAVDQQSIEDFRRSGLLHIMAVSGENVVLLCAMWSFAFSLLALPRLLRTALLVPIVITYVVLTGASPSIVRAGVAGVFALLAVLASRQSDGWLLWLVPAAWLLTLNPNTLYDVSFQLSFAAVLGLLLLSRRLAGALHFLPGPLPEQAGITAAASLSTAPISMLTFGSMSLVAVPANIVGGFVLGPIMFCGMLSLLLGFVAAPLSAPLNMLAGLFIGFLLTVARLFASLPWATWEWRGLNLPLVLSALGAAGLVAVLVLGRRSGAGVWAYWRDPRRRVALLVSVCVVVALALLLTPRPPQAPTRPTLTFLSVGEGAAALLQVPGGPTVLIDAGPAPLGAALRAHAVSRIDLLVLSHGHADHVAGLGDVLGAVPVRAALLPQPRQPLPEPRAPRRRAARRGGRGHARHDAATLPWRGLESRGAAHQAAAGRERQPVAERHRPCGSGRSRERAPAAPRRRGGPGAQRARASAVRCGRAAAPRQSRRPRCRAARRPAAATRRGVRGTQHLRASDPGDDELAGCRARALPAHGPQR